MYIRSVIVESSLSCCITLLLLARYVSTDRFIIRTPKEKPLLPKPSISDQNLPDANTCEDPELAHAINEAVKEETFKSSSRKGVIYNRIDDDLRFKIGKYAAENGVMKVIRKFQGTMGGAYSGLIVAPISTNTRGVLALEVIPPQTITDAG